MPEKLAKRKVAAKAVPKVTKKVISKAKNVPKKAEKPKAKQAKAKAQKPSKPVQNAQAAAVKAPKTKAPAKETKKQQAVKAKVPSRSPSRSVSPSPTPIKDKKAATKKNATPVQVQASPVKAVSKTTGRTKSKSVEPAPKPVATLPATKGKKVAQKKADEPQKKADEPPKKQSRAAAKAQRKDDEAAKKSGATDAKNPVPVVTVAKGAKKVDSPAVVSPVPTPTKKNARNSKKADAKASTPAVTPVVVATPSVSTPAANDTKKGKKGKKAVAVQVAPPSPTGKVTRTNSKINNAATPAVTKQPSKDRTGGKRAAPAAKTPEPVKKVKDDEADKKMVTAIKKGKCVVDTNCPIKGEVHVYETPSKVYDATLNQSNLDRNNNKYYIIQLLEHDSIGGNDYLFRNRWGRVGVPGQNALKGPMPLASAISDYESKFRQKTISGEYVALDISYDDDKEDTSDKKTEKKASTKASSMDLRIQDLINLIFDMKMMTNQMKEIGYDAKKMPLGKLGKATVTQGYAVLNKIMNEVKGGKNRAELNKLSSEFYTLIPHDFGFK